MTIRAPVRVVPTAADAAHASAERFVEVAREAVAARGRFSVALSGGGTPRAAYALLATDEFRSQIPWDGVHLFWGDERCVAPMHPRSNFGMANAAFVSRVPIPAANVHRMRGELPPRQGAEEYAAEVADFFGPGIPRFDLIHLGVGPDGHTCSLFPFDDTLRVRDRAVIPALLRSLGEPRITFTVPVLEAAARVEVLAPGADKAAIVHKVLAGPLDPFRLPIQLARPRDGALEWIVDRAAASRLALGEDGM